jgi:hypothetical protein
VLAQCVTTTVKAQEGRPVVGRERASQEVARRAEEQKAKRLDERRLDEKSVEERKPVTRAQEGFGEIDPTRRYNTEPRSLERLEEKVKADEQRRGREEDVGGVHIERRAGRPTEVSAHEAVDVERFKRLNEIDTGTGELKAHEAWAAAEFEGYWGSKLERTKDPSIDFRITDGNDKGKTVDFMLTETTERGAKINERFDLAKFAEALKDHVKKADIVPIETRFLTEENRRSVRQEVDKLSPNEQQQVLLIGE